MKFYVDIADLDQIKAVAEYFPIDGITTNPKILAKSPQPIEELMVEFKKLAEENDWEVFFQVTCEKAEDMLQQAIKLHDYYGKHLIVKIPCTKEGYKATQLIKAKGIKVCVTTIHSVMQAVLAAKAGADYVAPYINHFDNYGVLLQC